VPVAGGDEQQHCESYHVLYASHAEPASAMNAKRNGNRNEWRDVDLAGRAIRLRPELSKNKTGRVLPLSSELLEVVARAVERRRLDCVSVFHVDGQPIGDVRKAW
jgi:hypothetical protein